MNSFCIPTPPNPGKSQKMYNNVFFVDIFVFNERKKNGIVKRLSIFSGKEKRVYSYR